MGEKLEQRVKQGPVRRDPERDRSKAQGHLIKDPNNDQALRKYVEARDQVTKQVLEAVGGQSETVRKIFARGLTLTGSGGGALSTERGLKSPGAQRLGALKEAAQLQVLDWCVKRACELGGLTEQNLAKAYQEFIDAAKKVVPEDLLFFENGALSVKEGLFGKDNLWEKVQNQVLAGKNTPLLKSLKLEQCLEISNKILNSIHTTCAGAKKEAERPKTSPEPEALDPKPQSTDQAFTFSETQVSEIKAVAKSKNSSELLSELLPSISIETQPAPNEAALRVFKERTRGVGEAFWTGAISVGLTKYFYDQSRDNRKPATTPPEDTPRPADPPAQETPRPADPPAQETPRPADPPAQETPQPADPPNNAGPNAPGETHQGGGGGNPAQNSGSQQGGGTQQPTTPRPAGPDEAIGSAPYVGGGVQQPTTPQPAGPNHSSSGMSPSGSSVSNGSNINTGQPNLAFED
jgi:hypothetical protein